MRSVKRLTAEGMFDTEIEAYFPLERVSEAVEAATRAGRSGKIMLRISGR
jgi:hypothetical protein